MNRRTPLMMTVDQNLIEAILLACMDPNPINLSRVDAREVERARNAIKRAQRTHKTAGLREIITRNEFLAACQDHTSTAREEHLIIGYGWQYAKGTDIEKIHHVGGQTRSVHLTDDVRADIRRHHYHQTDAEVLVFHNHPRIGDEPEWLYTVKALLQDLPIPSIADRQVLQTHAYNPVGILRTILGQGQVRFYLGESNYVREFRLPPLLPFLERLRAAGQR